MELKAGSAVLYVAPNGQVRWALATGVWVEARPAGPPALNLVIVSADPAAVDSYGRQIERRPSVPHQSRLSGPGECWRAVGEPARVLAAQMVYT